MQSGSDPGTPPQPDIRAQIQALRDVPPAQIHLAGERSIQVTRQTTRQGFPAGS